MKRTAAASASRLEREVKELRRANEALKLSSECFAKVELDRRTKPICKVLRIALSGYRRHAAQLRDSSRMSARAKRDAILRPETKRVLPSHMRV